MTRGQNMESQRPQTQARKEELLQKITAYLDENLGRKITLQEVSREFNVSVSTVTQLFQRQSSSTFHQHLTQRRMHAAKDLIAQGMPLEEVGRRLGYTDHSSFYRAFRQVYGISPRAFRRAQKAM